MAAKRAADAAGIDIRFYNIIYNLLDEVKAAMNGLLAPVFQDVTDGYAEVRETFKLPSGDVVAGLYVLDGKITRNSRAACCAAARSCHEGGDQIAQALQGRCPRSRGRLRVRPRPGRLQRPPGRATRSSSSTAKRSHGPRCVDPVDLRRSEDNVTRRTRRSAKCCVRS